MTHQGSAQTDSARMRLEGKAAVVTGASRGLGRAIALAFAREGADVLGNYASREETAKKVAVAIEGLGRRAIFHQADVSDAAEVRAMARAAIAAFGRVDILVNNIASTAGRPERPRGDGGVLGLERRGDPAPAG